MEEVQRLCTELHIDINSLPLIPEEDLPKLDSRFSVGIHQAETALQDLEQRREGILAEIALEVQDFKKQDIYIYTQQLLNLSSTHSLEYSLEDQSKLNIVDAFFKNIAERQEYCEREYQENRERYLQDIEYLKRQAQEKKYVIHLENIKTLREKAAKAERALKRQQEREEREERKRKAAEAQALDQQIEENRRRQAEQEAELQRQREEREKQQREAELEAERLRAEKEEQERRNRAEKEEQERIAQAAREAEQAEKDRLERERLQKEQEDRLREAQEEKARQEREEQIRIQREAEDKARREQEERDRLNKAQEEAKRIQLRADIDRLEKELDNIEEKAQSIIEENKPVDRTPQTSQQSRLYTLAKISFHQDQFNKYQNQPEDQAEVEEDIESQYPAEQILTPRDWLSHLEQKQEVIRQLEQRQLDQLRLQRETGEQALGKVKILLTDFRSDIEAVGKQSYQNQKRLEHRIQLRDTVLLKKIELGDAILNYNRVEQETTETVQRRNIKLELHEELILSLSEELKAAVTEYQKYTGEDCPINIPILPVYYRISSITRDKISKEDYITEQYRGSHTSTPVSTIPKKLYQNTAGFTPLDYLEPHTPGNTPYPRRSSRVAANPTVKEEEEIEDLEELEEETIEDLENLEELEEEEEEVAELEEAEDRNIGTKLDINMEDKWSPKDCGKFRGDDEELPDVHLMSFKDSLKYRNIKEPLTNRGDCTGIVRKFLITIKGNARRWIAANDIDKDDYTLQDWKDIQAKFTAYFNPSGCTLEERLKAWKELKWNPKEEKFDEFCYKFEALAAEVKCPAGPDQVTHFALAMPQPMYMHVSQCKTFSEAIQKAKQCIAQGLHKSSETNKEVMDAIESMRAEFAKAMGKDKETKKEDKKDKAIPFMVAKEEESEAKSSNKILKQMQKEFGKMQKAQMAQVAAILDQTQGVSANAPSPPPSENNIVYMAMPATQGPTFSRFPSRPQRGGYQGYQGYQGQGQGQRGRFPNQRGRFQNQRGGRGGFQNYQNRGGFGRGGFNRQQGQNQNNWRQGNYRGNQNWGNQGNFGRGGNRGGNNGNRSNFQCLYCGILGHLVRDCRKLQRDMQIAKGNQPAGVNNAQTGTGSQMLSMMEKFHNFMQQEEEN